MKIDTFAFKGDDHLDELQLWENSISSTERNVFTWSRINTHSSCGLTVTFMEEDAFRGPSKSDFPGRYFL